MQPELRALEIPNFGRKADYSSAFGVVWAIEPGAGSGLWNMAQKMDLGRHVAEAEPPKLKSEVQSVAVGRQNLAVVMLTGTLMKSSSSMDSSTSTVQARREIRKAASDPSIDGIMLAIDSPGGTVSGTADLAAEVKAAAAQKPVFAFADDLCASAAYWIASQADQVFTNANTALVGSIGTLAVVYDMSGAAAEAGIKTLVFGTGPLKGAGTPGAAVSDEQQAYFRGLVEDAQVSFDAAVRKGRGLTDAQLAKVKTGGVFSASEAQSLKLIDGVQSFDQSMQDLAAEVRRRSKVTASTQRATSPAPIRSTTMNETTTAVVPEAAADPIATMRAAAAAEAGRIAGIQVKAAKHPVIMQTAIAEGWSVEKTELTSLREDLKATSGIRPGNPDGPHVNTGRGKWRMGSEAAPGVPVNEAIEAGLMVTLGCPVEKVYKPEVLQAAHESFRHIGLQGAIMLAAVENGYPGRPGERITQANLRQVLTAARERRANADPGLSASSSSISMSGILGNVANKELLAGYMEEDTAFSQVSREANVSNFQQATSYRMLDDMEYEEIGPDGKIKHGTAGQESYTRQVKTYGKMFSINRTNIINDDLGAFDDIRNRIGRGSAKKMNKVFWTAFMSNLATLFTTARTNYISGATTNLGTDGVGLSLGVLNFRKMTSPSGTAPLSADGGKKVNASTQPGGAGAGGRPQLLLVPPELEAAADKLYVGQNLNTGTAAGEENIHRNKYRPVVAWQLSNSGYTGNSTTQWFLLNDPKYLAAMVVSYLNGQKAPIVEEQPGDFDELCYAYRAYHDFGCDVAEYLAGTMSKGAA